MTREKRAGGKLSLDDVRLLKLDVYRGLKQEDIAEKYGVGQPLVSRIVHGRSWRKIPWPDGTIGSANMVYVNEQRTQTRGRYKNEDKRQSIPSRIETKEERATTGRPSSRRSNVPIRDISGGDTNSDDDPPVRIDRDATTRAIQDFVEKRFSEIEGAAHDEIHNAMFDVGEAPKQKKKARIKKELEDCECVPWKVILATLPTHPFIKEAGEFPRWKLPIQVALAALDQSVWDKVDIREAAEQVATLYKYRTLEIKKEKDDE